MIPTAISATVRIALSRVQYVKSWRLQVTTLMIRPRLIPAMLLNCQLHLSALAQ